jgi:hypothetical protein
MRPVAVRQDDSLPGAREDSCGIGDQGSGSACPGQRGGRLRDALVDEGYLGTPRFSLPGPVMGSSEQVDFEHPEVDVALFWVTAAHREGETLTEQGGTSRRAELYRRFTLNLFDEPREEELLLRRPGARLGVVRAGAYKDANGNGRKDEEEQLVVLKDADVSAARVPEVVQALAALHGASVTRTYSYALRGFVMRANEATARALALANYPQVACVERHQRLPPAPQRPGRAELHLLGPGSE